MKYTNLINFEYLTIGISGFLIIVTEVIHPDITARLKLWLILTILELNSDFWRKKMMKTGHKCVNFLLALHKFQSPPPLPSPHNSVKHYFSCNINLPFHKFAAVC